MDLKRFEDSINKKFQDFEPEVDSLKIWDNIETELPTTKKSKYFGLWIGLLLVPLAIFYFYNNNLVNVPSAISENRNVDDSRETFTAVKEESIVDQTKNFVLTESKLKDATTKSINEKIGGESTTNHSKLIASPIFAEAKIKEVNKQSMASKDEVIFAEAGRTNENVMTELQMQEPDAELADLKQSSIAQDDTANSVIDHLDVPLQKEKSEVFAGGDEGMENNETSTNAVLYDEADILERKGDEAEKFQETDEGDIPLASTKITEDLLVNADDESELLEQEANQGNDPKSEFEMPVQRLSFSVTVGLLGSNRIYAEGLTQEEILTIAEKETAEKQLETLQFDALLKYRISPRFSVGFGLRNWRLAESSTYQSERSYSETVDLVTGVVHHPDNTLEETTSPIEIQYHEVVQNTRYQSHEVWSVPVRLYYNLVSNQKFDLEIAGGYEHSLTAKHVGYELDENATEYLMTLDQDGRYKKNGGNYILININANHKIKNSLAITAGLEGKYGLNGFNTETARYQKKYHFFGLYTGLSYSF